MSRHENLRDTDRTMEILGNNNKKKMRVQRRQMASEKKRVVSLTKARENKRSQLSLKLPTQQSFRNTKALIIKRTREKHTKQLKKLLEKIAERGFVNITSDNVELIFTSNTSNLLQCYQGYLSKRNLRKFCQDVTNIVENNMKLRNNNPQLQKNKSKSKISRETILENYIKAVTEENTDSTSTFRDKLLSVPLMPSYDNITDRRLDALISEKTKRKRVKKEYPPLDALTVIQNLKVKPSIDNDVAQNRVADWAVKVGVEAKILKNRDEEATSQHSLLWDWRGRIEHDTIECHPHEKYVNYLRGNISSFWIEKQQNKSSA